jgi:hypothetical protein
MTDLSKGRSNWLKAFLFVFFFVGGLAGALWLAAEPICWDCRNWFSRSGFTNWDEHFVVTEYNCSKCHRRWKPFLNLHRPISLTSCDCFTVYY